jgi:hypothetical protein
MPSDLRMERSVLAGGFGWLVVLCRPGLEGVSEAAVLRQQLMSNCMEEVLLVILRKRVFMSS